MRNSLVIASAIFWATTSQASFEQAISAGDQAYRLDYKQEKGVDAPEPVGFLLEKEEDEILASVYFLNENSLKANIYGCHKHGDGYDCHTEDKKEFGAYNRSTNLYPAAEMIKALTLANDFFVTNVAPLDTVDTIKLWEAQENIRFSYAYNKDGKQVSFFVACHYHGGEMDCHRKRDAGPGEPGKK